MNKSRKKPTIKHLNKTVKISDEDYALIKNIASIEKRFIYYVLSCAINEYINNRKKI